MNCKISQNTYHSINIIKKAKIKNTDSENELWNIKKILLRLIENIIH